MIPFCSCTLPQELRLIKLDRNSQKKRSEIGDSNLMGSDGSIEKRFVSEQTALESITENRFCDVQF